MYSEEEGFLDEPPPLQNDTIDDENYDINGANARRFSTDLEQSEKKPRVEISSSQKERNEMMHIEHRVFIPDCCLRAYGCSLIDLSETLVLDLIMYREFLKEQHRNVLYMPPQLGRQHAQVQNNISSMTAICNTQEATVTSVQCYFSDDHNIEAGGKVESLGKKKRKQRLKFGFQGHLQAQARRSGKGHALTLRGLQEFMALQRAEAMQFCNRACCDIKQLQFGFITGQPTRPVCVATCTTGAPQISSGHHIDEVTVTTKLGSTPLLLSSACVHSAELAWRQATPPRGVSSACQYQHLVESSSSEFTFLLCRLSQIVGQNTLHHNPGDLIVIEHQSSPLYCFVFSSCEILQEKYYKVLPIRFEPITTVKYGQCGVQIRITRTEPVLISQAKCRREPVQLETDDIVIPPQSVMIAEYTDKLYDRLINEDKKTVSASTPQVPVIQPVIVSRNTDTPYKDQQNNSEYILFDEVIDWEEDILQDWSDQYTPDSPLQHDNHEVIADTTHTTTTTPSCTPTLATLKNKPGNQEENCIKKLIFQFLQLRGLQLTESTATKEIPSAAQAVFTRHYFQSRFGLNFLVTTTEQLVGLDLSVPDFAGSHVDCAAQLSVFQAALLTESMDVQTISRFLSTLLTTPVH